MGNFWVQLVEAIKSMRARSSVLSPMLWLIALLVLLLLGLVVGSADLWLQVGVFVIFLFTTAKAHLWFDHFAKEDPSRLCSEGYQLEERRITYQGDNRTGLRAVTQIDAPANPALPASEELNPPRRLEARDGA